MGLSSTLSKNFNDEFKKLKNQEFFMNTILVYPKRLSQPAIFFYFWL